MPPTVYTQYDTQFPSRNLGEWAVSCLLPPLFLLLLLWLSIRSRAVPFREVAGTAVEEEEVGL